MLFNKTLFKRTRRTLQKGALYFSKTIARKGVKAKKALLTREIEASLNYRIAYGPLRGTLLSAEGRWGRRDRSSMFFGLYEKEVLDHLTLLASRERVLIDIGAGDGYYAVGCLRAGLFGKTVAFETSELGRQIIHTTAGLNNVSHQIEIHGEAKLEILKNIASAIQQPPVILIDIEGAEFDLVTDAFLELFRLCSIIIEIHDEIVSDGHQLYASLLGRCNHLFSVREIRTGPRDPSRFSELERLSDDERWLICSEGRRQLGKWIFLEPL